MSVVVRVTDRGELSIPAPMRRLLGLEGGGAVSLSVEGGEIRLRSVRDAMAELQGEAAELFAGSGESVEAFLSDRRREDA